MKRQGMVSFKLELLPNDVLSPGSSQNTCRGRTSKPVWGLKRPTLHLSPGPSMTTFREPAIFTEELRINWRRFSSVACVS